MKLSLAAGDLRHAPERVITRGYVLGGRTLLLLTAFVLLLMPWTEYFWHFDGIPVGGQDFELGLLATITLFSLVLVLLQNCRNNLSLILEIVRWRRLQPRYAKLRSSPGANTLESIPHVWPVSPHLLPGFCLPARI